MDLTLIIAIITALAAIIAPVITALITQRGAYKAKAAEMFFTAKVDAFLGFLSLAAEYAEPAGMPSKEKSYALQSASAHALLFATPDTQEKIAIYGKLLLQNSFKPEDIRKLSLAHRDAILAMQSEIKKYE